MHFIQIVRTKFKIPTLLHLAIRKHYFTIRQLHLKYCLLQDFQKDLDIASTVVTVEDTVAMVDTDLMVAMDIDPSMDKLFRSVALFAMFTF